MKLDNGKKLTFLGDEPCYECTKKYVQDCDWLLSEANCLYDERDIHTPYEFHHSTVKEACELAQELGVLNLVLWHTEDSTWPNR
ncbi:MAG: MBL fold metallo-hydrolase, partial [Eubacteriales bacterium]